jgi:hypothetical protein
LGSAAQASWKSSTDRKPSPLQSFSLQPAAIGSSPALSATLRASSERSHSMPLSSTAITTSGRPVVVSHAPITSMPVSGANFHASPEPGS